MRFLRRSLTGLFLVALTVALLLAAGFRFYSAVQERLAAESLPPQGQERQFAVNVVEVTPTTLTPVLTSYGSVQARRTLELRAPAAGRIVDLAEMFEEGGAVRAGEVILRIDPAEASAALRVAEADLLEAQAGLRDAERALSIAEDDLAAARAQLDLRTSALNRQQSLLDRGIGSSLSFEDAALAEASARQSVLSKRQALADAQTAVDTARTDVLRAEIDRDEMQRTLDDMTVTAAFDGVLSEVSGAMGTLLSGNEQFATLIAPGDLEVAFRISTEQYARLVVDRGALPHMPVSATLDVSGLDLVATGKVVRESAAVAAGQTGRMLYARLDDAAGFRPGDFVTVRIEEPMLDEVALLPATAVAANGTVLAVTAQSRLEEVRVETLRRQGDDVIVAATPVAGRQIVAERSPLLGAGIRVRINGAETQTELRAGDPADGGAAEMVTLTEEQRVRLIDFVESNSRMPEEMRVRVREQLAAEEVPADLVTRLEERMGS
ncbi:efflux RND transporter periplasmic adaptor subunit [Celeribacter indicus]|uniref:RND family efflux transporter MFP subunit n=1 Tax=Celeribacter indicus TaxID=1208324 RepID=A0A0B5E9I4_9RHOB|nr:biotin/lipoyl-binding protein [Celeribacter indicus]AJE48992.1 RND family efflux transporter MFP subunit [Celeribacter indicus]SDW43170.1 Biotin-lipoyl like [Celeribacter indicus]